MTPLLEARDLDKVYRIPTSGFILRKHKPLHAVDGISLAIEEKACFGIVGETGSGKTTLSKLILQLERPTSGTISFEGQNLGDFDRHTTMWYRTRVSAVFQDAGSSLDPRMRVKDIVAEPLRTHSKGLSRAEIKTQTEQALQRVGLGAQMLTRYPHELSGGQKQRVAIARALILEPSLVILDEPVSALDVSIQAQILNLLADIRDASGLTYLIISHDLAMLYHLSTQIAVMYMGQIVEMGDTEDVFTKPLHPYTRALFAAIPQPIPGRVKECPALSGEISDPLNLPTGCRFYPRCVMRSDVCTVKAPELIPARATHAVACFAAHEAPRC